MSNLISKSVGHVIARNNHCSRNIPYITVYLWQPIDNYGDKEIDYPIADEYYAEAKLLQKHHMRMYDFLDVNVINYRTSKTFKVIEYVYDL